MGLASQFAMDSLNTGNPSLKDAMPIGTYAVDHLAAIIANLEMTFSDISGGSPSWIHTSILGSTLLFAEHLMRDGKTATGAPVVISSGYPSWDGEFNYSIVPVGADLCIVQMMSSKVPEFPLFLFSLTFFYFRNNIFYKFYWIVRSYIRIFYSNSHLANDKRVVR